jgi:glycosyltransferase involved in cell wall biosynthesis
MARGVRPHLAVLYPAQDLVPELEAVGVVIHDLSRPGERAARPHTVLRQARSLRSVIRAVDPAVVHSTLFDADVVTRLAGAGTGVPLLTTWASTSYSATRLRLETGPSGRARDVVRRLDAWSGRLARSRYHAVTAGVAADGIAALGAPPGRVRVVERGRDPASFPPRVGGPDAAVRRELGLDEHATVLLTVARQFSQKGHVHLLAAFDRLAAHDASVTLVMVGPAGPATPEIERVRAGVGHAGRVVDLGARTDVPRLLRAADVFVLASVAEGAAGAVIEAMAVGVPVVCTRLEGLEGVLTHGRNAALARPGDADDLLRVLTDVLAEHGAATERAAVARRDFEERFTLDGAADRMTELYRDVAAGRL